MLEDKYKRKITRSKRIINRNKMKNKKLFQQYNNKD